MSIKNKMLQRPASLALTRDTPAGAATTLAAPGAKGETTVTVTASAGFVAGVPFRIGDGELIERCDVHAVAGTVLTLKQPLLRDHAAGEPVVHQTAYNLGDTTGGIDTTQAQESTDVQSDMRRLVYDKIPGYGSFGASTTLLGLTLANLCVALGLPFGRITGDGVSASTPLQLVTDFTDVDSVANACLVATYVLQDGSVMTEEFWGVGVDYTALSAQLATGQTGAVPFKVNVYGGGIAAEGAPPFVASEQYRARKGKGFGELSGVIVYVPATTTPKASTVALAAAAAADVLTVADAAGFVAGDWIAVNVEDAVETHWIEAVDEATDQLTLRTTLLRPQAAGVPVVKLARRALATTREGATFAIAGAIAPIYEGSRRYAVGGQPGTVDCSVACQLSELTLAVLALALGIPEAAIANGRLDRTQQVGQAPILALAVEGVLRDGTVCVLNLWGCAQDLATVARKFGGEGTSGTTPLTAKPSSGVQFLQYAA